MVEWIFYPLNLRLPVFAAKIVDVFKKEETLIASGPGSELSSNQVLAMVRPSLEKIGFIVEKGKKKDEKINVPVLYGLNGKIKKSFDADAYHEEQKWVIEVEAGRGVVNNQFLKDIFQASMMHDVDYLAIAVRNDYKRRKDFVVVSNFLDSIYQSNRLVLPLNGILLIGY